jgi:GxxExxY protein
MNRRQHDENATAGRTTSPVANSSSGASAHEQEKQHKQKQHSMPASPTTPPSSMTAILSVAQGIEDAAARVFATLGVGHELSVYRAALEVELISMNLGNVQVDVAAPIYYKHAQVGVRRIDIILASRIMVQVFCGQPLDSAVVHMYRSMMSTMHLRYGILINLPQTKSDDTPQIDSCFIVRSSSAATPSTR